MASGRGADISSRVTGGRLIRFIIQNNIKAGKSYQHLVNRRNWKKNHKNRRCRIKYRKYRSVLPMTLWNWTASGYPVSGRVRGSWHSHTALAGRKGTRRTGQRGGLAGPDDVSSVRAAAAHPLTDDHGETRLHRDFLRCAITGAVWFLL